MSDLFRKTQETLSKLERERRDLGLKFGNESEAPSIKELVGVISGLVEESRFNNLALLGAIENLKIEASSEVDLSEVTKAIEKAGEKNGPADFSKVEKLLKKILKKTKKTDSEELVNRVSNNFKEALKEIKFPEVPEPKVTVKAPKQQDIEIPDSMKLDGPVELAGVSNKTPLPVRMMGVDGKPVQMTTPGASGGRSLSKADMEDVLKQEVVVGSNSSSSPLSASDSFTGDWCDTSGYAGIKVAVKADQDGSFIIQYSVDKVNVDSNLTRYYRTAQIEAPHKFENMRRYVRVVYTNGSTDQAEFRLETTLTNSAGILNIPVDSTMSQDYDAISVRPTNFKYEVALGRRQGYTLWNKFGYNTDVDTATDPEVVASFGGAFTPLTSASTLTIVSSSTADDGDPGGTGAQTIRVTGIDANRDSVVEDFTMDGTSNVVSTSTWLGINRVVVLTSGSGDTNAGTITITATTGGATQATIPVGESVTQQLIYFTPRNHQSLADWLLLSGHRFGSGTEPVITFKGWVYSPLTDTKYEVFRETLDESVSTELELNLSQPFVFTEQDVFWIEAETSRDDTSVYGRFSLITVRDVDA